MKLFLDTNVYVDFLMERKPFWLEAASIISYAADGCVDVCISAVTAVNANYICVDRFKMPKELMTMKSLGLNSFVDVLSVDASDVKESYMNKWKDFEDGVQFFCAKRNACDVIVTRNPKDFKQSDIEVMSPAEAIERIKILL